MARNSHISWIRLQQTDSTNRYLRELASAGQAPDVPHGLVVVSADYQTAGRGCGTNRWESERGQNLLFSVLYRPRHIAAKDQFVISMAVAVALREVLAQYGEDFSIKWPNDLYHDDRKISGMLIENQLKGDQVKSCIIGIGLNVNQTLFVSDAPNPVSLKQITGNDTDREELLAQLVSRIGTYLEQAEHEEQHSDLHGRYLAHLYRLRGTYRFRFPDGKKRDCRVNTVDRLGRIQLSWKEQSTHGDQSVYVVSKTFGFKEIEFII